MSTNKVGELFELTPNTKIKYGVACLIVLVWAGSVAQAQETSSENKLLVPDDLIVESNDKYQIEEVRVAGRLERLTLRRNNGFTEIYQNNRNDTIWSSSGSEVADLENVRQWKLGGW